MDRVNRSVCLRHPVLTHVEAAVRHIRSQKIDAVVQEKMTRISDEAPIHGISRRAHIVKHQRPVFILERKHLQNPQIILTGKFEP